MKNIFLFTAFVLSLASAIGQEADDTTGVATQYDSLYVERMIRDAETYLIVEKLDSALLKSDTALYASKILDHQKLSYEVYMLRGNILEKHPKKSAQAEENYLAAITIAKSMNPLDLTTDAMDCLFHFYENRKNYEKALNIYKERAGLIYQLDKEYNDAVVLQLNDSITSLRAKNNLLHKTIVVEREVKSVLLRLLYVLVGIILLLIILLIVMRVRNAKRRKKLQQEGSESLEQEKSNTLDKEKVLATQTKELNRSEQEIGKLRYLIGEQLKYRDSITKSLNEGLAEIISESRLQLELIGRDPSGKLAVDKYMVMQNLLTKASNETRNLSGNITTSKGTIAERMESLCNSFVAPGFKIDFINHAANTKLNNIEQTALLNVLSEILQNTLQHADATEVVVTLSETSKKLTLQVDDNGRGFDVKMSISKGTGIRSIISTMTYLNGDLDIVSDAKKGTHYVVNYEL